ncbi:MAG: excinuclease ABC subunit UvrA [Deltaproteobacteria bacterium]|nr:excinuclease ABC subunit UvrA [Deltaproteobacteria bacterium]MBW2576521.1 excinuclease ABC subunit UvrA [Deltaproteobacteria bacterium]MBW2692788.1 excinuclease ABC subunit UvrA [Deltaproteobacteria bacterium]
MLIRGAREHNLTDLDVCIPRDKLVVITGLSGSGKSSLTFDTIYAEGQRRYVESLSAYARQFLEQMAKPDVDSIDGLSPAIAIEQRTVGKSPRSTVGTATEIYDYLRLLYARIGQPFCHRCGNAISSQTIQQMTDRVIALGAGTKLQILAPVIRGRKGEHRKELRELSKQGFVRVRVDGEMRELADEISIAKQSKHDIEVVVDRIVAKDDARKRIAESIETAVRISGGLVTVDVGPGQQEWTLSEHSACVDCGISYPEIEPRSFSFNSPHGACPHCSGLGTHDEFEAALIVPDASLSISRKAIAPWSGRRVPVYYRRLLEALAEHYKISLETPWCELTKGVRDGILHGAKEEIAFAFEAGKSDRAIKHHWDGVLGELGRRYERGGEAERKELARYRSPRSCTDCGGSRLRIEARSIRVSGESISGLTKRSVEDLAEFFERLELTPAERAIAQKIVVEIRDRLRFLRNVGLDYLTLDRSSTTLSGGESQRIRLATQVGASLMGVLYILDEPSIGLHPRDNQRLLEMLARLRDGGNSVLVVEHDEATIRAADFVIDMGPGAGIHGGQIVALGTPAEVSASDDSITGDYLAGRRCIGVPKRRRPPGEQALIVENCRGHNLKNLDVRIPLGLFTAVTGVSGSGKSTLINDTLYRALAARLHQAETPAAPFDRILGLDAIDKVVNVSQSPIGRTPRSNPATYTGALSSIRQLFSQVPEARIRGYAPGRFSFNVKGGRCEACQGNGTLRVEMHFLPDIFVTCEECAGRRYNRETLEIRYKGYSIADVLEMSVEEALGFAENVPSLRRPLQTLFDVGLGYLHVGQSATTLSGGEAQRVKLAKELSRRDTGRTLYLLDEPTTGLHFADVEQLLGVLDQLVEKGNTVVVIEHHPDVIKTADYVIDLGPEGGEEGGTIVVSGTPEEVSACPTSHTGKALREVL